jgi:hypothetical protein
MGQIIRHGYRSQSDKDELQGFYNTRAWKDTRRFVVERAGGLCEWCNLPPTGKLGLDVVHLYRGGTLKLLREHGVQAALNPEILAAGHRKCHMNYQAGHLEEPRRGIR